MIQLMKRQVLPIAALVFVFAYTSSQASADDWIDLFDGRSLEGWEEIGSEGSFRVENGTIIGRNEPGDKTTFLCTMKEYDDFELQFAVRLIDTELNSGVQLRAIRRMLNSGKPGPIVGPQVEINGKNAQKSFSGLIFGQGYRGYLTPDKTSKSHPHYKQSEWNDFRVVVRDKEIKTWLNGIAITTTTLSEDMFAKHARGVIGLQVHGIKEHQGPWEVAFKDIRIREL